MLMVSSLLSSSMTLVLRRPLVWSNRFWPELHPRHLPVMYKRIWTYLLARTGAAEGTGDGQSEAEGLADGNEDGKSEGNEDGKSEGNEDGKSEGNEDGSSEEFS